MEQLDTYFYSNVRAAFAWAPDWVGGLAVLAAAALLALALHRVALRLLRGMFKPGNEFARRIIDRTYGPTRLALVIVFVSIALGPSNLSQAASARISHGLLIAFILLMAWIVNRAMEVSAGIYLRRFRIDVEDNLLARKHITQIRVLRRAGDVLLFIVTLAAVLMTFSSVREYGVSLLASAGAAGIVLGLAARPVLANLIAGIQLAVTQPIRIDDAVVVEGEWGWIEEITGTYVVIRIWDWRRLIVPLSYFMEKPFQNWTRETAHIIGTVMLNVDYRAPVGRIREKLNEIVRESRLWDGKVVNLQVTDATERTIQLRALVSARNSPSTWDLRCEVREKLVAFLQEEYPDSLPRYRAEIPDLQEAGAGPVGGGPGRPA
ncbi:mechanosensitive ion channel family protein, partial [Microbaculum marinum]